MGCSNTDTVTVIAEVDTIPPTITNCPNGISSCSQIVGLESPLVIDNCTVENITISHDENSIFPIGITTVTYSATDRVGQFTDCVFAVEIHPSPSANAGLDTTISPGQSVTLGDSPTGTGGTGTLVYLWMPSEYLDSSSVANPVLTIPVDASCPGPTSAFVSVLVTDSLGCTDSDEVVVAFISDTIPPVISNCPEDQFTCSHVTAFVPPTAIDECNLYSYQREQTNGGFAAPNVTINTYTATDDAGNTSECVFEITQNTLPVADAGPDQTIIQGNAVVIGGSPTGAGDAPIETYLWFPSDGLDDPAVANPSASPDSSTTYVIFAIDTNGCAASDQMTLIVNPAFTRDDSTNSSKNSEENEMGNISWEVHIYPNPVSDILNIEIVNPQTQRPPHPSQSVSNKLNDLIQFSLIDVLGRKIYHYENDLNYLLKHSFDVSQMQAGQYLLKMMIGEKFEVRKFVIEK
jgi:hypothetical protein